MTTRCGAMERRCRRLTINDNQIQVTVTPGSSVGAPASVVIDPAVPYYTLEISVTTGAAKTGSTVQMERAPGSKVLRIYGSIGLHAQPDVEEIAIQDPAEYAAVALKRMLEARGLRCRVLRSRDTACC